MGLRPWHLLRKFSFILRTACPQTPCKDGIHPRSYERGPLPWFDSPQTGRWARIDCKQPKTLLINGFSLLDLVNDRAHGHGDRTVLAAYAQEHTCPKPS